MLGVVVASLMGVRKGSVVRSIRWGLMGAFPTNETLDGGAVEYRAPRDGGGAADS